MLRFSMAATLLIAISMTIFAIFVITFAGANEAGAAANIFHYGKMQIIFAIASLFICIGLYFFDYHWYKHKAVLTILTLGSLIALALVLCPGIGVSVKGSRRWISLGFTRLQPVEFVKFAIIATFSAHMENVGSLLNRSLKQLFSSYNLFKQSLLLPITFGFGTIVLLILQPDFGAALIVCSLAGIILLLGGFGFWRCVFLGCIAIGAIAFVMSTNENRRERFKSHTEGTSYQEQQSLIAFHNGGLTGQGAGKGIQRQGYLPECHTDFILSIVGEDFGLIGTGTVLSLFMVVLICGTHIAKNAPDKQGMLLAYGSTIMICAQAAANMGVVTGLLPTKGLALPFFSYGGSSLIVSSIAMMHIVIVGKHALRVKEMDQPIRPRIHKI